MIAHVTTLFTTPFVVKSITKDLVITVDDEIVPLGPTIVI